MDASSARHSSEPRNLFSQSPLSTADSLSPIAKDDTHGFFKGQGRGSKHSKPQATSYQQQSYSPRQLLDPKGAVAPKPRASPDSLRRASPLANVVHKRASEEPEAQGMGNFIERIHGITDREERPQKRQKTDKEYEDDEEEEEEKKATFAGGGKGGEIGEYMRERRKEAQAKSSANGTVVDLTAGT